MREKNNFWNRKISIYQVSLKLSHSIYSTHASFEPCNCRTKLAARKIEGLHGKSKQRWFKNYKASSILIHVLARHARKQGARIQDISKILHLSTRTVWKWTADMKISFKGKNRAKKNKWGSKQIAKIKLVKLLLTVQRLLQNIPIREIKIARLLDEH